MNKKKKEVPALPLTDTSPQDAVFALLPSQCYSGAHFNNLINPLTTHLLNIYYVHCARPWRHKNKCPGLFWRSEQLTGEDRLNEDFNGLQETSCLGTQALRGPVSVMGGKAFL